MMVGGAYDPSLVALSFVVASLASYTALDLGGRIRAAKGWSRLGWLTTAAIAMGGGIWSMHFIGMLAFQLDMPVSYDVGITTLSLLLAVALTAVGFSFTQKRQGPLELGLGGLFMGLGIVAMHYTGMAAMRMSAHLHYNPTLVALSVVVAIGASIAALALSFRGTASWLRVPAAIIMGFAIAGMHYTAMAAAMFTQMTHGERVDAAVLLGQTNLALSIGGISLLILTLTLIASAFDRRFAVLAEQETLLLRRSEEYLQHLYRNTPLPLHSLDRDGRIEKVSDAWLDLIGCARKDVIGRKLAEFMTPESQQRYAQETGPILGKGGAVREAEFRLVRTNGDVIDVLLSARGELERGKLVRTVCGLIDITARKRAEEGLQQSQRMEAIGQLTGGVAHDFNNLLMVVGGAAERLKPASADAQAVRSLDMITTAVERGRNLTKQLLSFSRRQAFDPTVVDLTGALPQLADMLKRSLRGDIELRCAVPDYPCRVRIDKGELELALLNLGVNARDAMPDGGILTISVGHETVNGHDGFEGPSGDVIVLQVRDTGVGISQEILPRVFEPFFTTKGVGKGTGLGLSQVYGFAKQSSGTATVRSIVGRGTSVWLSFPECHEEVCVEVVDDLSEERRRLHAGTVLLVEDNNDVAAVTADYFAELGYEFERATNGAEALRLLRRGAQFDLVFSDILMPGNVAGLELGHIVREYHPEVAIVLTTGYSEKAEQALRQGFRILRKPFALRDLRRLLSEVQAERKVVSLSEQKRA